MTFEERLYGPSLTKEQMKYVIEPFSNNGGEAVVDVIQCKEALDNLFYNLKKE